MVLTFLTLLGAVGLFLYGMNLLSNGILKLTGDKFSSWLGIMKKNPISSIVSGAEMAAIAESSSAATVTIVSFANAGAITLAQAILMIMGANIGATLSAWFIAVCGFSFEIGNIAYPFIALGFVLLLLKGRKRKIIGEAILGFAFIFLGLSYMMNNFPIAGEMADIKASFDSFTGNGFLKRFSDFSKSGNKCIVLIPGSVTCNKQFISVCYADNNRRHYTGIGSVTAFYTLHGSFSFRMFHFTAASSAEFYIAIPVT